MNLDFSHSLINGHVGIDHILSTIRFYNKTLKTDDSNKQLKERLSEIEWLYSKLSFSFLNFIQTTSTIHSILKNISNETADIESKRLLKSILNLLNQRIIASIHDSTKLKREKEKTIIMSYMKKHSSQLTVYIILCQKVMNAEELITKNV